MAAKAYNREEVLNFVLADSGDEKSDSDDEFVADVKDEFGETIILPDLGTNIAAHEREPMLYLDEDLNEVSVTNIFPFLLSLLEKYCGYNAVIINNIISAWIKDGIQYVYFKFLFLA